MALGMSRRRYKEFESQAENASQVEKPSLEAMAG